MPNPLHIIKGNNPNTYIEMHKSYGSGYTLIAYKGNKREILAEHVMNKPSAFAYMRKKILELWYYARSIKIRIKKNKQRNV